MDTAAIRRLVYDSTSHADDCLSKFIPVLKAQQLQKKLLIVDDEKPILRSLERLFRKSSYSVLTANTATEALLIIESEPLAVLLSDFSMPDMTGATLLANAKRIRPEMTRIILSGNSDQAAVIESINKGAAHRYLTKPWDDEALRREIDFAFELYLSTQYVSDSPSLLTTQAFAEQMQSLMNNSDERFTVLAFRPDKFELQSIEDFKCLQNSISHTVASLPWLSDQDYALGLLDPHRLCLCVPSFASPEDIAEKLMQGLPMKLRSNDLDIPLKYRLGYTSTQKGKQTQQVLYECTTALKEAASTVNSNPLRYKNSQSKKQQRKASIESRLFAALDKKELHLNYQPKIQTSDHTLCGAEALVRWNSPELGHISPMEFIPIAESNDLIHPIGLWVMEQSIQQWMAWFGRDFPAVRISINVSPVQLEDLNLLKSFENLMHRSSINPACVELELTETSLMRDADSARDILRDLKALGLRLSIDDFGTGYSSLSYLSQLPIDTIKIDRSFILPMLTDKKSENLVKNIIAMARDLNKETVAEGVETEEQLIKLSFLGCDVIQGYFFSKPLAADEFHSRFCTPPFLHKLSPTNVQNIEQQAS